MPKKRGTETAAPRVKEPVVIMSQENRAEVERLVAQMAEAKTMLGVDVQGTLKPGNLYDTLATLLSLKSDRHVTVTTGPPV